MEKSIVGREKEIMELKKYLSSEQSEFIAVYGRRRVGKTFLIKELLEEAILDYKIPNPSARRDAVEKIWDALERLKTYYTSLDKKASAFSEPPSRTR